MTTRVFTLVAAGLIAVVLVSAVLWFSAIRGARATLAASASCTRLGGDAYDVCMGRHGLNTAALAQKCQREPSIVRAAKGSQTWATALASCIDLDGGRATIASSADATGNVRYSVHWNPIQVSRGVGFTFGNVTTETETITNSASSAP